MFYQNHAQSYQPNDIESQSGHPRPIAPNKTEGFRPGRFTTAQNSGAKKNC